ncbi:hypothetical protein L0B52_09505 [Suttonella sp. R2A3]|uniref:hypothetical protein n=1 Tax=Suttonella sp. R2A3 TaxID=2908648 RepID=UPI001F2F4AA0|nr:hypothetical protein [Suttonella sp. R2A3]UJF24546.1 hypothetical protein L0B52_09505 [Suttonella sp. R2A3]
MKKVMLSAVLVLGCSIDPANEPKLVNSGLDNSLLTYQSYKEILDDTITLWENINKDKNIAEAYQTLLRLEKSGDEFFSQGHYGKAWNHYSMANRYYPSPKVLIKGGDAYIYNVLNRFNKIHKTQNIIDDELYTTIEVNYLRYKIRRYYNLALDFNEYLKKNNPLSQILTTAEVKTTLKKVSCLNQKLNFEGSSIDTSILRSCL